MKKKLTLLFTLLTLCVSGWAVTPNILAYPQDGKIYYIAASKTGTAASYVYCSANNELRSNKDYTKDGSFAYLWLCSYNGNYYQFRNLLTGKYMCYASVQDAEYNFNLSKEVTNSTCCTLYAVNEGCWMVTNIGANGATALNKYSNNKANSDSWNSDYLFEEYGAATLVHNQYYYIYGDAYNISTTPYTSTPIYLYKNESSLGYIGTNAKTSAYIWRCISNGSNYSYSFTNASDNTKYLGFHGLTTTKYDWTVNPQNVIKSGRAPLYGFRSGSNEDRYMMVNTDVSANHASGFSTVVWKKENLTNATDYNNGWTSDYMFITVPQSGVCRVVIKTEGASSINPVFSFDGINYSGSTGMSFIYVDNNNLPDTKSISVSSYDDTEYTFTEFQTEAGSSIGSTVDVSALSTDKAVVAVFASNRRTYTFHTMYDKTEIGSVATVNSSELPSTTISLPSKMNRGSIFTVKYYSDSTCDTEITTYPSEPSDIYVNYTWAGPFTLFADYASINEWKFLKLKEQRYVTYEEDSDPNVTLNQTSGTVDTRWAFVGNPITGLTLYNKTAGGDYVLASAGTEKSDGNSGGSTYTRLVADDDETYTHNVWIPMGSNAIAGKTGFYLYDDLGYALNLRANGNLAYWTGGTGDGSTFTVENANINFASEVAAYSSYFVAANQNKYFGISTSDAEELQDDYDTYSVSCTEEQYLQFRSNINSKIIIPETGYYRLKNKSVSSYLGATTGLVGVVSGSGAETIISLTNNGDGSFYLAIQGQYIKISNSQYGGQLRMGNVAEAIQYLIPVAGSVILSFADGNWTHKSLCLNDGLIKNGLASAEASKWELQPASSFSVNLNAAEDNTGTAHTYATLCVPFNITDLTGVDDKEVKAYAPTKSGDYISPGDGATEVTEGTPVLLIGEEGATSVTATIGSNYTTAPKTTNALTGVFTGTAIDTRAVTGTNFVLGKDVDNSNRIGFYHVNNENFALNANRAYLKLDGSGDPAHVKGFVISFDDDDETAIENVNANINDNNAVIYNVAGQRLNKMQKGINIVNGKKVLK